MLSSIIRRSITCITLRRFYVPLAGNNYAFATNQRRSKDSVLQRITLKNNAILHRYIGNKKNDLTKFLPLLPGYVHKTRTLSGIVTMFLSNLYTMTLMGEDFNLRDIVDCIKTVACKVSGDLANKNYDCLVSLVKEDTLGLLQKKIDSLTEAQRSLIAIREEDVTRYDLVYAKTHVHAASKGDSEETRDITFTVELKVLIFYKPRYGQIECIEGKDDDAPDNLKLPDELVANYVFTREYIEGKDSDWTIAYINLDTTRHV